MEDSRTKAKRWCFTINNPTDADKFWCVDGDEGHLNDALVNVQYFILQEERGREGTLHWQGFIIFKDQKRLSWLKRRISARAHWEVTRGSNQQAADYCRKDETYTGGLRKEYGDLPAREVPKKDERLLQAAEELDTVKVGYKRPGDIDSMTLMQCGFIPAYKEITADILGPYRPELKIITMVGRPATGKSFTIQSLFPDHGRCIVGNHGCWFQNPCSNVMVFEEFNGQIPLVRMNELLDPYPLALEVKGGMRPAMFTLAIITSNSRPDTWYAPQDGAPFPERRIKALEAFYDRLGYSNGAYVPARDRGLYIEDDESLSIAEARKQWEPQIRRFLDIVEDIEDPDSPPLIELDDGTHGFALFPHCAHCGGPHNTEDCDF